MFLKNYTSEVPVHTTVYRIEQVLLKAGVTGIAKEYIPGTEGKISAITFAIKIDEGKTVIIRLPVNEEQAQETLELNYVGTEQLTENRQDVKWNGSSGQKKKQRKDFREQAERTAWKIMQDWVEVQLSMIQMKQADFVQVFLPYMWDGRQTYYEQLKAKGFAGMLPERTD